MADNEIAAEHKMIPMEEFDVVDEAEDDDSDVFISADKQTPKVSSSGDDSISSSSDAAGPPQAAHGAEGPDLHTLGRLFLPNKWLSIPFDISVMLHLSVVQRFYWCYPTLSNARPFVAVFRF